MFLFQHSYFFQLELYVLYVYFALYALFDQLLVHARGSRCVCVQEQSMTCIMCAMTCIMCAMTSIISAQDRSVMNYVGWYVME